MSKLTLKDVHNIAGSPKSAMDSYNANNRKIEEAIDSIVSRDGEVPSVRLAPWDMNSNRMYNGQQQQFVVDLQIQAGTFWGSFRGYSSVTFQLNEFPPTVGTLIQGELPPALQVGTTSTAVNDNWDWAIVAYGPSYPVVALYLRVDGSVSNNAAVTRDLFFNHLVVDGLLDLTVNGPYWYTHTNQEGVNVNGVFRELRYEWQNPGGTVPGVIGAFTSGNIYTVRFDP